MTEHVCHFRLTKLTTANCVGDDENCHKVLVNTEIESRLNEYETLKAATEKLSAEDAMTLYHSAPQRSSEDFHRKDALFDYANILEGKDERTKPIR